MARSTTSASRWPTPASSTPSRPGSPTAGLASVDERDTTCCYARQDKFWVEGSPDGERWEVYTVLADSPTFGEQSGDATCCSDAVADETADTQPVAAACC